MANLKDYVIDQLNQNFETYLRFNKNKSYVEFQIIHYPFFGGHILELNVLNKQDLLPYIEKYNIDNYQGDIKISKKDDIFLLLYKDKILNDFMLDDSIIVSYKKNQIIMNLLERLLQNENEIYRLSFELKGKNLLYELQEFYRYFALDSLKSYVWLDRQ